jgi:ESS family glutamate:Na+ symporter
MNPIAGALIEVTFEGGHGTAAGMGETFTELGFPEGGDMALGLATVGIVTGIIAGTILTNWGRSKGYITESQAPESGEEDELGFIHEEDTDTRRARAKLMRNFLIDPLSLNFGFVALAVAIGWLILEVGKRIEFLTWGQQGNGFALIEYVPLFPMALIGGIIVQVLAKRFRVSSLIMRPLQNNIAGLALDVVIITALATISLSALGENLIPFILISVVGIVWTVGAFIFLAPRLLPSYWFERGIGDMGQSMGVTATGILLIRMADPDNKSGAFESFAYKQLFFEPIVGGGLFTAAAPALIDRFGLVAMLIMTGGLLIFWLVFGFYMFRQLSVRSTVPEISGDYVNR